MRNIIIFWSTLIMLVYWRKIKNITEALLYTCKLADLEANAEKTKYVHISTTECRTKTTDTQTGRRSHKLTLGR
jgi:hypothetical protein